MLDLIMNCPAETFSSSEDVEHIVFTQPGMRYCQAQALVYPLMKDELFNSIPAKERRELVNRILEEVRGRMLEEIVLMETSKTLPKNKRAFKLEFAMGEFDMVIFDEEKYECQLYEIKHTDTAVKEQCKYLLDKEKCDQVEYKYGTIIEKTVLYRGQTKTSFGVTYKNVEEFLKKQ